MTASALSSQRTQPATAVFTSGWHAETWLSTPPQWIASCIPLKAPPV
ncbi:hypothetical protein A1F99_072730 [Pyrenophora tritici-repentis]|nr:hypothetical protein A1F99_072730 [Pyrenophora tritici-repentis]KAI0583929.1 hypothetical protein Alg215_03330 [Pyrenophora tritici-repentis]